MVVTMVTWRYPGENRAAMLARLSVPDFFFSAQMRAFGQEGPDDDERQRRDHAGNERVAPGGVVAVDGRQGTGELNGEEVGPGDQKSAERGERLGVAKHGFPALGIGEEFGKPGDRGNKLNADADERGGAQEQQHRQRGREPGGEGREGVQQDRPDEDAAAAEAVRQVAAIEAEQAAGDGGNPEQQPTQ
jgi:hypothetical protein